METSTAIKLLAPSVNHGDLYWADLGCGTGTFTIALASLLSKESTVYAVDRDAKSLETLYRARPEIVRTIRADFTDPLLSFPSLNGILMANSLHFVADKNQLIQHLNSMLLPDGRILIIEYDTDTANTWVPYPVSFGALQRIVSGLGLVVRKTGTHPSIYGGREMYAALVTKSV